MGVERRTELLARRIVEARFGLQLVVADHNTGESVHDYDVPFRGVEPGALEVFVAANPDDVQRSAAHSQYAGEGYESALLSQSWVVSLGPTARFKNWTERVEPFLVQLEARGISRFALEDCYRYRELMPAANALGFEIAHAFDSSQGPPAIFVSTSYGGVAGSPDDAAKELQELLWATHDVRRKLETSKRSVREAFVLVHVSRFSLWRPVEEGLPSIGLDLPPEITGTWLARGDGLGWRFDARTGWEPLESIPGIQDDLPER